MAKAKETLKHKWQSMTDEQGRGVLVMTVRDDEGFLSPYSVNDSAMIATDVADFLTDNARAFPPPMPLALHIHSDCIDAREQTIYRAAIANYFALRLLENQRDMRRNTFTALLMLLVGIAGLAGMFLAEHVGVRQLWIECIDIFAWVFVWEAVDQCFIERGRLRRERQRLEAFTQMPVIYSPLKDTLR